VWRSVAAAARREPDAAFNLEERRQLQQVVLHARADAQGGGHLASLRADIAKTAPAFVGALRASLADVDACPSRAQDEVASSLEGLGLEVEHEYVLPEGLSVDVALRPLAWRVAVEFDGPRHYFVDAPRAPTGRTAFKRRLLKSLGWRVLHVPSFEWADLPDEAARRTYLRRGLADIVKAARAAAAAPHPPRTPDTDNRDEFDSLKVTELRALCEKRGLDRVVKRGTDARDALTERLRDAKRAAGG